MKADSVTVMSVLLFYPRSANTKCKGHRADHGAWLLESWRR